MKISPGKARLLLADDHTLVSEAFKKLLEPQFEIVATVSDGRMLLDEAQKLKPDVVLLDLAMPLLNGLDAGRRLRELLPTCKIIVVTMNEDVDVAAEVLRNWASGFLLKKAAGQELIQAIHDVLRGKKYVTPEIARGLSDQFVRNPHSTARKDLTRRQREVLQLLAEGRTMKEVADVLNLTPRTVAFHKYKIMEEFGAKTNSDLVLLAIKERIIPSPDARIQKS